MKERVYLYTRVSTLMQTEGYSLEAQRQKILDYAKFRDFSVVGEYSGAGFSEHCWSYGVPADAFGH